MNNLFIHKTYAWMRHFIKLIAVWIFVWSISCDQMTDNYKPYLEGGEIIYPGKADSVQVHPGKYRIELQWLVISDPSVSSAKVYWDNKLNSVQVPIVRTGKVDTVKALLEDMEERVYTFEIQTFDDAGNKSVIQEAIGTVYGDKYRSTLLNRAIWDLKIIDEEDLEITWATADANTVSEELIYTNTEGRTETVICDVANNTVLLRSPDLSEGIKMTTVFMPDSMAIDTFKTAFEEIKYEVVETSAEVDRSRFSLKNLPGDENTPNSATNSIDKIWTNPYDINATPFISKAWALTACNDLVPFPYWFTIDMGAAYNLTSFTLFQRSNNGNDLYKSSNLKKFEIWGALEVDEQYNPKDHGDVFDDNWILLQECEIIPPVNQSTWLAEASLGHEFNLRINGKAQKVRYLRIKAIDNWQPENGSCPLVKKRTYINVAAIRLDAVQQVVQFK